MIQKAQIEMFLSELRKAIASKRFVVIPREKNNAFLARYGMTPVERQEIVANLTPHDYRPALNLTVTIRENRISGNSGNVSSEERFTSRSN